MIAHRALALAALLAALLLWPARAPQAHPMGNFSINHYTAIRVERGGIALTYRIDIAEIPAFTELASLDRDGDPQISPAEREAYLARKVEELTRGQSLLLDGRPAPLEVVSSDLRVTPGAGGLSTLWIAIDYAIPLGEPPAQRIQYSDDNYPGRPGWREIVANRGDAVPLFESDVPAADLSHGLTAYPADLTTAPPQLSRAELRVGFGAAPGHARERAGEPDLPRQSPVRPRDAFASLISAPELSPRVIALSLLAAFALGMFHALSPGHGKTVVAAYLVGSKGTARHAFLLGALVTFTHTASVFALGVVALFASAYLLPEQLYPWLGFTSGMTIVGVGVWQFAQRYRSLRAHAPGHGHHHHHEHGYDHGHEHDHHHDHGHGHDHGPAGHSHALPDRITPGNLIALGVSGGLVPCPSALVVLLGAVTLNRVGFGLLLIAVFSVGLASILIAIGLLMLHARRLFERLAWEGTFMRRLPLVSSAGIAILGLVLAVQALVQGGIVL